MNIQEINQLTSESVSKLTSDQYKAAFEDATTGRAFAARVDELQNSPRIATRPNGSVRQDAPAEAPALRADFSGDPSWSDVDDQPAPAPVAAQPVAQPAPVAELPEKIHEYQPVDRNGRPVGGKQVFKYRTDAELIEKLTKAHSASSARIRELSRDRKLDSIAAAGAAPRIQPEKEVPTTVEGLAAELRAQRQSNFALSVRAAVNEFQASVGWTKYRSDENAKSVILAVERAGDDPTDPASYQRAFHNMRDYLEPVSQPVAAPVPAVEPAPVAAPAPAPVAAPARNAQRAGISTGLSNADGGEDYTPAEPVRATVQGVKLVIDNKTQLMTLGGWDRLSSDSQKKILRNSANAAAVNALYEAQAQDQAARRAQGRR